MGNKFFAQVKRAVAMVLLRVSWYLKCGYSFLLRDSVPMRVNTGQYYSVSVARARHIVLYIPL